VKTDPRDERIAELEARIDKLVDAIAELASQRPTVVYPVAVCPSPCTRPHADLGWWYVPPGGVPCAATASTASTVCSGSGAPYLG